MPNSEVDYIGHCTCNVEGYKALCYEHYTDSMIDIIICVMIKPSGMAFHKHQYSDVLHTQYTTGLHYTVSCFYNE